MKLPDINYQATSLGEKVILPCNLEQGLCSSGYVLHIDAFGKACSIIDELLLDDAFYVRYKDTLRVLKATVHMTGKSVAQMLAKEFSNDNATALTVGDFLRWLRRSSDDQSGTVAFGAVVLAEACKEIGISKESVDTCVAKVLGMTDPENPTVEAFAYFYERAIVSKGMANDACDGRCRAASGQILWGSPTNGAKSWAYFLSVESSEHGHEFLILNTAIQVHALANTGGQVYRATTQDFGTLITVRPVVTVTLDVPATSVSQALLHIKKDWEDGLSKAVGTEWKHVAVIGYPAPQTGAERAMTIAQRGDHHTSGRLKDAQKKGIADRKLAATALDNPHARKGKLADMAAQSKKRPASDKTISKKEGAKKAKTNDNVCEDGDLDELFNLADPDLPKKVGSAAQNQPPASGMPFGNPGQAVGQQQLSGEQFMGQQLMGGQNPMHMMGQHMGRNTMG